MDYNAIYDKLIEFRKSNKPNGYTENHHIVMKSLGGDDNNENLVELTAREHYIAHLLLVKINPCQQTFYAIMMMQCKSDNQERDIIRNSRMYEWARKQFAKYISCNQKGKGNSQFGTMWICNIDHKENKKIKKDELIPEGWIKGRNKWKKPLYTRKFTDEGLKKFRAHIVRNICLNTMWISNLELKKNKKIKKDILIPEGWVKGRINFGRLAESGLRRSS